ncbi:LCP family glycopolymer transferase [Ligilactobacillus equi]|nr:LCP family protein [Ligilactobacillus equi]
MANDHDQVQHKHHGHHHKHKKHNAWKLILGVIVALIVIVGAIGGKFYFDAKKAVDSTYKTVKTQDKREGSVNLEKSQPFSVLLLGVDTGEYGRTYQGRSDTMMVAAIAPKKSTLVSIPRDTKVAIANHGSNNKINAAYAYGDVAGAINTLQNYLDIPIDHYVEMDMKGMEQLSKAVGPVKVDNDLDFTNLGHHFDKGMVTINSDNILAYTRMRYEDSRGDYGRQMRQRIVLMAMVKKIASFDSLTKYQQILNAISSNVKTDLTFDDIKTIAANYNDGAADNIEQIQLQGQSQMIDGVSFEIVPKNEQVKVQKNLKQALKIKE